MSPIMRAKLLATMAVIAVMAFVRPAPAAAQSLDGTWDATVVAGGVEVPFRMALAGSGAAVTGTFFNGDETMVSSSGSLTGDRLSLEWDALGTKLDATLKDGQLEGEYTRGTRGAPLPFKAKKFTSAAAADSKAPSIAGLWVMNLPKKSSKGEDAWRLIVRQAGPEVSAAILRVDGDTGTLTGTYRDGTFVLGHFSGARPLRLEITPQADGSLAVVENRNEPVPAIRDDQAKARGVPQPTDPTRFTSVKDPNEPLRWSFPDLTGKIVSNTDAQFRGKVVIVDIAGSWCPNCHDETPFLVDLYRKYHGRGLEIVALSFEEAAQLQNPVRLKAFIKHYNIPYTVLVPGEPKEASDKLPQAVNLNSFPTTFFVGRDGRVKGAHAGFPGKASGKFHEEAKQEIAHTVEQLLAERPQSTAGAR
jgi:thiol-disulfide isomerase/thioredoxin